MARIELSPGGIAERARRTARGSLPPAGVDDGAAPAGPDGRRRRAIRQRLRRTRSLRRARVAELGALVADMQGRGRWNQKLVDDWAADIDRGQAEAHDLERALQGELPLADAPIAECGTCGRIVGAGEQFCTGCGNPLPSDLTTIRATA
jgi:hypothetical protein